MIGLFTLALGAAALAQDVDAQASDEPDPPLQSETIPPEPIGDPSAWISLTNPSLPEFVDVARIL